MNRRVVLAEPKVVPVRVVLADRKVIPEDQRFFPAGLKVVPVSVSLVGHTHTLAKLKVVLERVVLAG